MEKPLIYYVMIDVYYELPKITEDQDLDNLFDNSKTDIRKKIFSSTTDLSDKKLKKCYKEFIGEYIFEEKTFKNIEEIKCNKDCRSIIGRDFATQEIHKFYSLEAAETFYELDDI